MALTKNRSTSVENHGFPCGSLPTFTLHSQPLARAFNRPFHRAISCACNLIFLFPFLPLIPALSATRKDVHLSVGLPHRPLNLCQLNCRGFTCARSPIGYELPFITRRVASTIRNIKRSWWWYPSAIHYQKRKKKLYWPSNVKEQTQPTRDAGSVSRVFGGLLWNSSSKRFRLLSSIIALYT